MKIGLDATPLTEVTGGIARYTWELSVSLARQYPADEFYLLSDRPFGHGKDFPENLRCPEPAVTGISKRWWSAGLPRAIHSLGVNLFHGTDFSVPYRRNPPSVMTVHDLSPWKSGTWHRSRRIVRRTPWLLRFGLARAVITPSETVRKEVISHFGLPPDRVTAVPLAAASCFRPTGRDAAGPPYFLIVGTLEPRKNIGVAVDAWRVLRRRHDVKLKIVGRSRSDSPVLESAPGLEVLGVVGDEELARLYSNAVAVLMPSVYEGFGLPVLEAMQCGAPVAISSDPALAELSGGAALRITGNWHEALEALFLEEGLRARHRALSLARARQFSWVETARRTHAVYQQVLELR